MAELTAPFVIKNDEKRIVYGPVLVPDEPDSDNDIVSKDKIEQVAYGFMEQYGNIDLQHSLNNVGKVVESYILPFEWKVSDEMTIPAGSWMMGVKVQDETTWDAVKSGALTGFSIMGISKAVTKSADKAAATKRTTLADLGEDWIVNAVSLVDEPAVPKAKWIAIKSRAKKDVGDITEETVKKAIEGSLEHRESLVRRKVYQTFDSQTTDSYVHSTMEDSVIIRISNMLNDSTKMIQLGYAIDAQGNVNFTTEPTEVRIQETVVPVQKTATKDDAGATQTSQKEKDDQTPGQDEKQHQEATKGLLGKIMEKLGWKGSEKAGRRISDANYTKLKAAQEVINELLGVAESERAQKQKEEIDMNEEQVKSIVTEAMKGLTDKVDEIMSTLKSAPAGSAADETQAAAKADEKAAEKAAGEEKPAEKAAGEEKPAGETVSKSEYDEVLQQLEALKKKAVPFSRRLTGQDGEPAEKAKDDEPTRDAFGFKSKAKA